jgi:hypothetical protein
MWLTGRLMGADEEGTLAALSDVFAEKSDWTLTAAFSRLEGNSAILS